MSLTVDQLEREAQKLSEQMIREAHRRDRAMDTGEDPGYSAEEVFAELRARTFR
jgi:hypothetical protein